MAKHTYKVDEQNRVSILVDNNLIDTSGFWDSYEGADAWGKETCANYNDPKINTKGVVYPEMINNPDAVVE